MLKSVGIRKNVGVGLKLSGGVYEDRKTVSKGKETLAEKSGQEKGHVGGNGPHFICASPAARSRLIQ